MPYCFAHDYCAREALRFMPSGIAAGLREESKLYSVGSMGPDIFFYHKVLPLSTKDHARHYSKKLHTQNVGCVFRHMLETVYKSEGALRRKLFAYFAGYVCHYALDCAAHPYVFNRAGMGPDHTRFEADMDVALIRLKAMEPQKVYRRLFEMPKEEDMAAAALVLGAAMNACFDGAPAPEVVSEAIYSMYRIERLLLDPHGWKRGLAKALGKLVGAKDVFIAAVFPKTPDIRLDSLNLARRPWREPWPGGMVSDARFVELLEGAAVDASDMIRAAHMFFEGEAPIDSALSRIGARSFHTGLDCEKAVEFDEIGTVWDKPNAELPKRFRLPD